MDRFVKSGMSYFRNVAGIMEPEFEAYMYWPASRVLIEDLEPRFSFIPYQVNFPISVEEMRKHVENPVNVFKSIKDMVEISNRPIDLKFFANRVIQIYNFNGTHKDRKVINKQLDKHDMSAIFFTIPEFSAS
jgi:hypothetical protein